jgi:riboflavin synthase
MFTGIIETIGTVTSAVGGPDGKRFTFESDVVTSGLEVGDSVAVNGVCLTATEVEGRRFRVEAIIETLERTNLGEISVGDGVNLERAMPASGRFDGHIVQGHIDGTGVITRIEPEGDGQRWTVEAPSRLLRYVVEKGSITVNGVSLTVAALFGPSSFQIALIPHTLEATTFGTASEGDAVNLEVDILAKYVERLLEART